LKKAETVTFTTTVEIADADGEPIRVGSVLREINDGEQGVVVNIYRAGDRGPLMCAVGDVQIATGSGCSRMTNRYNQWRHVPRAEQTYEQRFSAWMRTPADDPMTLISERVSKDAALAIDGIMALLPEDIVDWENGPWPDTIEEALGFLVEHLSSISK